MIGVLGGQRTAFTLARSTVLPPTLHEGGGWLEINNGGDSCRRVRALPTVG